MGNIHTIVFLFCFIVILSVLLHSSLPLLHTRWETYAVTEISLIHADIINCRCQVRGRVWYPLLWMNQHWPFLFVLLYLHKYRFYLYFICIAVMFWHVLLCSHNFCLQQNVCLKYCAGLERLCSYYVSNVWSCK